MSKVYSLEQALKELGKDIDTLSENVLNKAKQQIPILASQTHAMILEKAQSRLRSTRDIYTNAVSIEQIEGGTNEIWAVTLDKSAKWLEEGQPRHEMIDYLVNGPKHKVSKEGHKYNIIPFEHSGPKSSKSLAQNRLAAYVKTELKKRGLDKTITKDGKPVLGRAATLNLTDKGAPVSRFNKPLLSGLTIYQREHKTRSGKTQIKRSIMTFRVVSEKQKGSGLWEHPGRAPLNLFNETAREIDVIWKNMVETIVKES